LQIASLILKPVKEHGVKIARALLAYNRSITMRLLKRSPVVIVALFITSGIFPTYAISRSQAASNANSTIITGKPAARRFVYRGRPIHPFCLDFGLESKHGSTKLPSCADWGAAIRTKGDWLEAAYPANISPLGRVGVVSYRVIAAQSNMFLLETTVNGGGTGYFDSLEWVTLDRDGLRQKEIVTGGDRCHGGFARGAWIGGHFLHFSRHVTTVGILALGGYQNQGGDLEDSAASCFGLANYEYDFLNDKVRLVSVTLAYASGTAESHGKINEDTLLLQKNMGIQSCFNLLFDESIDSGKSELKDSAIQAFANAFKSRCVSTSK